MYNNEITTRCEPSTIHPDLGSGNELSLHQPHLGAGNELSLNQQHLGSGPF
jgi:hypothetical protein